MGGSLDFDDSKLVYTAPREGFVHMFEGERPLTLLEVLGLCVAGALFGHCIAMFLTTTAGC